MATTPEYRDYVMEQLCRAGECTLRRMMGEYCIYYRGKLVGDLCDNVLYLKPTESALRLMPDAERGYPYEGSRTLMLLADDLEDAERMRVILEAMYNDLPEPKAKTKK